MQFKVPQFLEIEDKIFGPFTFRQFAYLCGGGGMCFVIYKLLGFWLGLIPIAIIAGLSLALSFYRPNNKPFIDVLEAGLKFAMGDKLYIWKRRLEDKEEKEKVAKEKRREEIGQGAHIGRSKLRDLAWSLDVLDLKKDK